LVVEDEAALREVTRRIFTRNGYQVTTAASGPEAIAAAAVLASQGRLDPNVALVAKPFSEADLLAMAGRVLNGHFPGFTTADGGPAQ
jgi:hypothetical protein